MKGDIVFRDDSQGSNIHENEILCDASDELLTFRFLRKPDAFYGFFLLKPLRLPTITTDEEGQKVIDNEVKPYKINKDCP